MLKRTLILLTALILVFTVLALAAPTFQQIAKDNQEMRKNIVWLTEGLLNLNNDSKLALTKDQKKKILPIFQDLVSQKIVVLQREPKQQHRQNNNNEFRTQGPPDLNDPLVQARIKKLQEATVYGNTQADAIDRLLNQRQLSFIDNMDFDPEKYGLIDFGRLFGGSGQRQGQRPNQASLAALRKKIQAGRERLIKLNNQLMKILSE
ncbi:MAG: hypothetical protein ACM3X9_01155 [Bacillota bacterium]